jgi:zinc protease
LLLSALAHAAMPPAPPAKAEIAGTLPAMNVLCWPSGLQVVVVRDDAARHVALTMVLDGGASAEDPSARGAAHLLEHLWFRSTPGTGGVSIWDGSAGLSISASTRLDSTVFTTIGASSDLPALLALEGQRLVDPLVGVTAAIVAS